MRVRIPVVGVVAATVLALLSTTGPASAATGSAAAQAAAAAAAAPDQKVIVVLKDQPAAATPGTAAASARSHAIAMAQAPVIASLGKKASHVKGFRTADAFAATVPAAQVAALRADAAVAAVVPDSVLKLGTTTLHAATGKGTAASGGSAGQECSATPQLDESATVLKADSDDPKAVTARSLGYTGAGTKVAFIAEGIDTSNVNFLRDPSDPTSSIFADYKDFSGDGPDAETSGAEAFLDANAIAGQGKHVYDVSSFPAIPTPSPCNVRIEGIAPGAQLVGLKVFSNVGATTTSAFLQAIDYAVLTDHVDVLNESFGGNPLPDTVSDVVRQFDEFAVASGTTVTVSSGDSGPFNTNGSPSTDPAVIAVGATMTLRVYQQTNYAGARVFAKGGWVNGNISPLSSSGVSEDGQTLNVVAPGDASWASCTPTPVYEDCVNLAGDPSDIEESGGTSESAPLTAGAAALVIQAYEKAHHGDRPSPALVKRIITSTATDLGVPGDEQGAGLVNTLAAVRMAASINAAPKADTLLKSADELTATGTPGSTKAFRVSLTNTGASTQHVSLAGRAFSTPRTLASGSVTLSDASSPKFVNDAAQPNNYATVKFTVKPGTDLLLANYAYAADPAGSLNGRVRLILVDPKGRLETHSRPQGIGNNGTAEVRDPQSGTWTAVIFGITKAKGGTEGPVPYTISTERAVSFGAVHPSQVTLRPGASTTVTVVAQTPSTPGDAAASLVIASDRAGTGSIPIALRSTIDVRGGGAYSGVLSGGNGRDLAAQQEFYRFRVPSGVRNITANLTLANDPSNAVGLYLVGPGGDVEGYGQNSADGSATLSATAWTLKPVPGEWTLIVGFATPVAGNEVADPFVGSVAFDAVRVAATGLPNDSATTLQSGVAVTVPVTVTNNGAAPAQLFVDARGTGPTILPLAGITPTTGLVLPTDGNVPLWFVPTETTRFVDAAVSTLPVEFDTGLYNGDPDIASRPITGGSGCATTAVATYPARDRTVASGAWYATPSECGPYSGAAPTGTVDFAAAVVTRPFDTAVTSPTGDLEQSAVDPSTEVTPVIVQPGATVTIPVTITPTAASGTTVRGDLFVDAVTENVPPYGQVTGDELESLPYAYTVK